MDYNKLRIQKLEKEVRRYEIVTIIAVVAVIILGIVCIATKDSYHIKLSDADTEILLETLDEIASTQEEK